MPSPLGHILAGAAVYVAANRSGNRSRVMLGMTLFASVLPDFDFLPGILIGHPAAFHHGVSHSLAFALLFGMAMFLVIHCFLGSKRAGSAAVLVVLAYASHVMLDLVSASQGTSGVPILWPLSNEQFGINLNLFAHFHHGGFKHGIWSVVLWDNVRALASELFVLGIPVLFLLWRAPKAGKNAFAAQ